jgi:uncharacterized protein Yka (UPF0111/DUF47 family)
VQHTRPRHFYEVFADLARGTSDAARILHRMLAEPDAMTPLMAEMSEVERASTAARHELLVEIDGATVTPLDREDVHQVAMGLAGLVSLLHQTARRVQDLGVTQTREAARKLAELLVSATGCVEKSVAAIRTPGVLVEARVEMERICEEGIAVYDQASATLFAGSPDPMEVLRWKEVYDALEHALTQSRGVQNMLSSISLENR